MKISTIDEIISEASQGKIFILVDDENRENEGDLCILGDFVNPESINFMAKYGRGLICLAITEGQSKRLGLTLMHRKNESRYNTAFTESIEARSGVTTGISASDRAITIKTAIIIIPVQPIFPISKLYTINLLKYICLFFFFWRFFYRLINIFINIVFFFK